MSKNASENFREEFHKLKAQENEFRERLIHDMNYMIEQEIIKNHKNPRKSLGIEIEDGPTRISSWDDQVSEVVVGVLHESAIIDEGGSVSFVKFENLSLETLVDTYCALELEVENQSVTIADYSLELN